MIIKSLRVRDNRNYLNRKPLYHIVWDHYNPDNKWRKGYDIHHRDGDTLNDHISNLELMTTREHRSMHLKGKSRSEETKQKISKANKGRKHTEESCKNMSISHIGFKHTEDTRRKMSETRNGKPTNRPRYFPSEETKNKISISGKKAWVRRKGLC